MIVAATAELTALFAHFELAGADLVVVVIIFILLLLFQLSLQDFLEHDVVVGDSGRFSGGGLVVGVFGRREVLVLAAIFVLVKHSKMVL